MSFVAESVSGSIRFKGIDCPSFTFSSSEVDTIKKVWENLDLANYSQSVAASSSPPTDTPTTTTSTSPRKSDTRRSSMLLSPSKSNIKSSKPSSSSLLPPLSPSVTSSSNASSVSSNNTSQPSSPSKPTKSSTPLKGTLKIYDFQVKLCGNILKFEELAQEPHQSSHSYTHENTNLLNLDSEIETNQFHLLRFKYQTDSMIQMITYVISNLNNLSGAAYMLILKLCHFNARVWAIDKSHYHTAGESLILTLIEILGRTKFPPEYEVIWIKFYNKLLKLLLWHAEDAKFELSHPKQRYISSSYTAQSQRTAYRYTKQAKIHVPAFSSDDNEEVGKLLNITNAGNTFIPESTPGNTNSAATCSSSAKSSASILSLQTQDDISSLSTLDQSPRKGSDIEGKNRHNANHIDAIPNYMDEDVNNYDDYSGSYSDKYSNGHSRIPRTISSMSNISQPIFEKDHESDDGNDEEVAQDPQQIEQDYNEEEDRSFDLYNAFSSTTRVKKRSSITRLSATLTKSRSDRDLNSSAIPNSDTSARRSSMSLPLGRRKSSGQLGALVNSNGYPLKSSNESIGGNGRSSNAIPSSSLKTTPLAQKRSSRSENCVVM